MDIQPYNYGQFKTRHVSLMLWIIFNIGLTLDKHKFMYLTWNRLSNMRHWHQIRYFYGKQAKIIVFFLLITFKKFLPAIITYPSAKVCKQHTSRMPRMNYMSNVHLIHISSADYCRTNSCQNWTIEIAHNRQTINFKHLLDF